MKKLPDKIKLALARYFDNRRKQFTKRRVDGLPNTFLLTYEAEKVPSWDKDADRDKIADIAKKYGWGYSASGGTFWFTKGKTTLRAEESNYLNL